MKIHFLQHVPFEGIGCIQQWADDNNCTVTSTQLYDPDYELPQHHDYDLLVIMGGPMNIYEYDTYPWLLEEKTFIKEAVRDQKYILGICLGAQLLADVSGGQVVAGKEKEIGWMPVSLIAQHDLLYGFPKEITVLHWHGDTFTIPPKAQRVASTDICPNQAFILYDRMVGLQFHFEATEMSVNELIDHSEEELAAGGPFVHRADKIKEDTIRKGPVANDVMFTLLDNMYSQIKRNVRL